MHTEHHHINKKKEKKINISIIISTKKIRYIRANIITHVIHIVHYGILYILFKQYSMHIIQSKLLK